MPTARTRGSVVVLYNSVSDEGYDALKHVDPASLGFTPTYDIAVATVAEEYEAIIAALRKEGFQARGVNLQDKIATLERLVRRGRPDVVFNLVESFHDDAELEPAVAGFLADRYLTLPKGKSDKLTLTMQAEEPLVAPIARAQRVGTVKVALEGRPMAEFPLIALEDVAPASAFGRAWDTIRLWFRRS